MKAKKILNSDIKELLISSLPSRPTAPRAFGGRGYTAEEMKKAFDRLPLFIIERYNELLNDIYAIGEDSLASNIPTGIKDGHTLNALFEDVKSGELATYFSFFGKSLLAHIITLYGEIDTLRVRVANLESRGEKTT